ncbi:MAG: non-reducing end alpha-L-arabinofuranosidase family hydrolase [Bryobacteraceae bacterium]
MLPVTNLNDSGPGSLRAACLARGPRTVVFRVSGAIALRSDLNVREPYLTIAGQTAPGGGICLRDYPLNIVTHDVIVRFLRSRLGDESRTEADSIWIGDGARNVILDHCSASWSVDEALSPSGDIRDVTVQWCFIGESLWHSGHAKGAHGYGSLARATGGVSLHHNLWIHNSGRNPRLGDNYGEPPWPTFDLRNNVMYNWGSYCTGMVDGNIRVNYVANYLKPGPDSRASRAPIAISAENPGVTEFYLDGNIMEQRADLTADNRRMTDRPVRISEAPFEGAPVETEHPTEAFRRVAAQAGASVPYRDPVDARLAAHLLEGGGRLIDSQNEVGGWPDYVSTPAPQDGDGDGMPDWWESAMGLDPGDASDGAAAASGGYTNLERYLAELAKRWYAPPPLFLPGPAGTFDETAVKDPSIVYAGGKWRLFYTARGQGEYTLGYAAAANLEELRDARRFQLKFTGYAAAPQVFYFEPQKKWYLIFQTRDSNYQPVYSTTQNMDAPESWSAPRPLVAKQDSGKWIDFWVICDETRAYLFYTRNQRDLYVTATALGDFPAGWGAARLVWSGLHEAVHVYKVEGEPRYVLLGENNVEGVRSFSLLTAPRLEGDWKLEESEFAFAGQLQFAGERWTGDVSHGELLRSGYDQKLEVKPGRMRFLIQGAAPGAPKEDYPSIPWRLGILTGP